jgi:hypothetical protein
MITAAAVVVTNALPSPVSPTSIIGCKDMAKAVDVTVANGQIRA